MTGADGIVSVSQLVPIAICQQCWFDGSGLVLHLLILQLSEVPDIKVC